MITILSRKDLSKQTEKYVLVEREDTMYVRVDDEYVRKMYFTVTEAADILGIKTQTKNRNEVHRLCSKLGIQARANRKKKLRITFKQLRQMANL